MMSQVVTMIELFNTTKATGAMQSCRLGTRTRLFSDSGLDSSHTPLGLETRLGTRPSDSGESRRVTAESESIL